MEMHLYMAFSQISNKEGGVGSFENCGRNIVSNILQDGAPKRDVSWLKKDPMKITVLEIAYL